MLTVFVKPDSLWQFCRRYFFIGCERVASQTKICDLKHMIAVSLRSYFIRSLTLVRNTKSPTKLLVLISKDSDSNPNPYPNLIGLLYSRAIFNDTTNLSAMCTRYKHERTTWTILSILLSILWDNTSVYPRLHAVMLISNALRLMATRNNFLSHLELVSHNISYSNRMYLQPYFNRFKDGVWAQTKTWRL